MFNKTRELEIGGLSFGVTSGVITTLGMIIGINTATESLLAVISAILVLAVCDSLSDAMGMHLSEDGRLDEKGPSTWIITIATFLGKLIFSLIFILPFLIFDLSLAVIVSVAIGLMLIVYLAMFIAKRTGKDMTKEVFQHTFLTIFVVIISYLVGNLAQGWIK